MSVKIGHASIDENNKARGGNAGDQTKKEVCTRTWYNKPWTSVIRPKDSSAASIYYHDTIVTSMEALRVDADILEQLTDKSYWPYPTYSDLLYY